jgi:hypothetical protein
MSLLSPAVVQFIKNHNHEQQKMRNRRMQIPATPLTHLIGDHFEIEEDTSGKKRGSENICWADQLLLRLELAISSP